MSAKHEAAAAALASQDPVAELERRGWAYRGTRRGLRWYRTMPYNPSSLGHSYIVDDPRLVTPFYNDGYNNYRPVMEFLSTDAVLLDWDMAVSREDRQRFEQHIADDPDIVHVAPYRLYPGPKHADVPAGESRWAAFPAEAIRERLPAGNPEHLTPGREDPHIREGEPYAAIFGFGMVYLPLEAVRKFLAECSTPGVTDSVFCIWHYRVQGKEAPVHWDVRPVHLNYEA